MVTVKLLTVVTLTLHYCFLQYEQFKVASAKDKYKLTVGGFQGTTTDSMATHNGMYFTTKDNDNDQWSNNCAIDHYGRNTPTGG